MSTLNTCIDWLARNIIQFYAKNYAYLDLCASFKPNYISPTTCIGQYDILFDPLFSLDYINMPYYVNNLIKFFKSSLDL